MSKAIVIMLSLLLLACAQAKACGGPEAKAQRYIKAYPDFFTSYADGCLVTRDGNRIPFDDGRKKDLDAMVTDKEAGDEAFDPEDALYWHYPAGSALPTPSSPPRGDPGRIRPGAVFRSMYGSTPGERAKKMRNVTWIGSRNGKPRMAMVTTANGVDKALERVAREIEALPEDKKKELEGIALNSDGPYGRFDRPVRGFPGRTSGHAYGIAVDINGNLAYFSGSRQNEPYCYRNNVPAFLVDIFERNGFIWGGRWHSYDAMHFEYRPELLLK